MLNATEYILSYNYVKSIIKEVRMSARYYTPFSDGTW
jgi:hypothetical protein